MLSTHINPLSTRYQPTINHLISRNLKLSKNYQSLSARAHLFAHNTVPRTPSHFPSDLLWRSFGGPLKGRWEGPHVGPLGDPWVVS